MNAQPLPNATFVAWEDGSTNLQRFLIVGTNAMEFTALFVDVNETSFLSIIGWNNFEPSGVSFVQYPRDSGRTKLSFSLNTRQSYQVFRATDLGANGFSQIAFAASANGPVSAMQRTSEAGTVNLWVLPPQNSAQAFYRVRQNGSSNYPSLFFAQASNAPSGAAIVLYGEGLTGTPNAWAGTTPISATSLSDNRLRVTLPSSSGSNFIMVAINGFLALGGIPINISTNSGQVPVVSGVASLPAESGGLLEVRGTNFTSQSEFFIDGSFVQIFSVSGDGTVAVLIVPVNLGGSRQLTLVNNGAISSPFGVNLRQSSFAYSPSTTQGTKIYSWMSYQPNAYNFTPTTATGVRVYAYHAGFYSCVPASISGVRVYSP